ncbi:MAG: hypothetical protein ACREGK_06450, partial [Geminicoccales bacterium]
TRPRVRLELDGTGEGRCTEGGVTAAIRGKDAHRAIESEFGLRRKRLHTDRRRPHRVRIPAAKLDRSGPTQIRARVTLRDGRRVDLRERIRRCG